MQNADQLERENSTSFVTLFVTVRVTHLFRFTVGLCVVCQESSSEDDDDDFGPNVAGKEKRVASERCVFCVDRLAWALGLLFGRISQNDVAHLTKRRAYADFFESLAG